MFQVVLIGSKPALMAELRERIQWAEHGCEVCGTADSAAAGTALIRQTRPHIVFAQARMPDGDALEELAGLRGEMPEMRVTVLADRCDYVCVQRALRLGVTRFLVDPPIEELYEALRAMTAQFRQKEYTPPPYSVELEEDAGAGSFVVRQAMIYMEQEYAHKLTLQDVADHCFVSPWYLSRLIHRYIQKNFYDVLNAIRIRQAKRLLADSELKIGEIVESVGYSDSTHFAHTFKKSVGVSASQYRNQYRTQTAGPRKPEIR